MVFPKSLRDSNLILKMGFVGKIVACYESEPVPFYLMDSILYHHANHRFIITYLRQLTHLTGAYHPIWLRPKSLLKIQIFLTGCNYNPSKSNRYGMAFAI